MIHTAAEAVELVVVAVECDRSSSNISSGIGSSRGIIRCIIRSTRGGSSCVAVAAVAVVEIVVAAVIVVAVVQSSRRVSRCILEYSSS